MGKQYRVGPVGLVFGLAALTQTPIPPSSPGGKVLLRPTDAAVLATPEHRRDLGCEVTPLRPQIGFDLQFHSGYAVRIPRRELTPGNLRLLARVTSVTHPDEPVYLTQRFDVPPAPEDAAGEALLEGRFVVGEGRYRVDWLLRDGAERVCSAHWELTARSPDRNLDPASPPDTIAPEEDAPVTRDPAGSPLHVRILLHVAPQHAGATILDPTELDNLVAILRAVTREPRFGRFTLVAFAAAQRRILFRQDDAPRLDFAALREALSAHDFVRVEYRHLLANQGDDGFLSGLLGEDPHDLVLVVGAKAPPGPEPRPATAPVYFLRYTGDPQANPWSDPLTQLARRSRGRTYTVTRPGEFASAWRDIRSRLAGR